MTESINDTQRAEETRVVRNQDPGYTAAWDRIRDEEAAEEAAHRRERGRFPW